MSPPGASRTCRNVRSSAASEGRADVTRLDMEVGARERTCAPPAEPHLNLEEE